MQQFPRITELRDISYAIKDRDEFRITEKDGYIVANYAVAFDNTFEFIEDNEATKLASMIRREIRGLIFDLDEKLISRPYHKFFNVGERDETQLHEIDLSEPHVILEKLDGSMIRPLPTKDGFRLATKAGITDVAMNAEVFIANKANYSRLINSFIALQCTPIFEWVSRKNRIVIDYPEDNLILTAVRVNSTGQYLQYDALVNVAVEFDIPYVNAIAGTSTNLSEIVDHIRKWSDSEGAVIRFDNGHMVKIKADQYVTLHRTKDLISSEKNVIELIIDDKVDDVLPLLDDASKKRLSDFQRAFCLAVDETCCDLANLYVSANEFKDKKDFAINFVQKLDKVYHPFMYGARQGKRMRDILTERIRASLKSQTTIDQNRWLWCNLKWN